MSRILPLDPASLDEEIKPYAELAEASMGFLSDDTLIMAKIPPVLRGMAELAPLLYTPGSVGLELKALVTYITSTAAGCYYCSSHQMLSAAETGVSEEKIKAAWEYESSPLFSDAERAALRLGHHAGLVPNATTDEDFDELKKYFSEEQILELVAVIAMFGFLNRWNDTIGTTLESKPTGIRNKLGSAGLGQL